MQGIDKRRKTITLPEVAENLGISYATAWRIVQDSKEGKNNFPYRRWRKNGAYSISRKEFLEWIETTMIYAHLVPEHMKKAMDRLK